MIDPRGCGCCDRRLCVIGNAKSGLLDHRKIVGAVAGHQRIQIVEIECLAQVVKRFEFGRASQYRLDHFAGELAVFDNQCVGAIFLKAGHCGDRIRKQREAAGDEAGIGTVRAHGADQFDRARCQRDARFQNLIDHRNRQSLQQRHAFAQRRLEFDLAAHRPLGDRGDMRFQSGEIRQFVDAFLSDHGGIHVGEQQFLAAVEQGLHHRIDTKLFQCLAQHIRNCAHVVVAAKADVGGDALEQPLGLFR